MQSSEFEHQCYAKRETATPPKKKTNSQAENKIQKTKKQNTCGKASRLDCHNSNHFECMWSEGIWSDKLHSFFCLFVSETGPYCIVLTDWDLAYVDHVVF